jgi:hypothetical protein
MLKQVKDALGSPPYYVCTSCNWAWKSLHEANQHKCGNQLPFNAFTSYSKSKT